MYKVASYKDILLSLDPETVKRFEIIEKLSKGFTVENAKALELDTLLAKQIELEQKSSPTSANFPSSPAQNTKPEDNAESLIEVERKFRQLLKTLKERPEDPQNIRLELPNTVVTVFQKPSIPAFQQIVDDVLLGNPVFLVGGAGTGKTYLAENIIAKTALGRKHITINCSQWTAPTEIIGGQTMDGYVEGKLIEAWANGYVLVLDELPKIDPNTAGLFNDALAKTKIQGAVIFNSRRESFKKHDDFACIATGNVYPDKESLLYGANNKQDLSLLDRFSGSVYWIEKNPSVERQIIQNDLVWGVSDQIRTAIEDLKYEAQLSLRFMMNARDTYNLEMLRITKNAKDGIKANDGKTLKGAVDSFISVFTDVQKRNIREKIKYDQILKKYDYRALEKDKTAY